MITTIVLTGGPCGGKTKSLDYLQKRLSALGYIVFTIPESATEILNSGITREVCGGVFGFQIKVMQLQMLKETFYKEIAYAYNIETHNDEKIVLIYDRGIVDCLAFLEDFEYDCFLKKAGGSMEDLLTRYDIVIHLDTAALGESDFYSSSTNGFRSESPSQAIRLNNKLSILWKKHPHLLHINNQAIFNDKMEKLFAVIVEAISHNQ